MTVKLTHPWLHPWLAAECPLTLKVPSGVKSVRWHGESIPVSNGFVELNWNGDQ